MKSFREFIREANKPVPIGPIKRSEVQVKEPPKPTDYKLRIIKPAQDEPTARVINPNKTVNQSLGNTKVEKNI